MIEVIESFSRLSPIFWWAVIGLVLSCTIYSALKEQWRDTLYGLFFLFIFLAIGNF